MAMPMTKPGGTVEAFCADLRAAGLDAPWTRPGPLIALKASAVEAHLWRWADIEPLVRRGPEFMAPGRGAERRVIRLDNPGVPERTATHTISAAVQYLLPGEVAPAHRHTPNAVRFMLRGEGAFTTVEGERCDMRPGDLVLTPSMTWHDHGNAGPGPVMWLDGLDSPVRCTGSSAARAAPRSTPSATTGARATSSPSRPARSTPTRTSAPRRPSSSRSRTCRCSRRWGSTAWTPEGREPWPS